jgi:hypothetical protein
VTISSRAPSPGGALRPPCGSRARAST